MNVSGRMIAPASRLGLTRLWRRIHPSSVPVLIFHGVLPHADRSPFNSTGKFTSPDKMRTFLGKIARLFRFISVDDFTASAAAGRTLRNAMLITFDDGYANNYEHGLPVLSDLGLPATVFVATGLVDTDKTLWNDRLELAVFKATRGFVPKGICDRDLTIATGYEKVEAIAALKQVLKQKTIEEASLAVATLCDVLGTPRDAPELGDVRFLTSAQIRTMADRGITIGGHSVSHPILARETPERVRFEVEECKKTLEAITCRPVSAFAYPNGRREDFNQSVKQELERVGYTSAFTSIHGLFDAGDDLFEIRRMSFDNRWSYPEFEVRMSGLLEPLRR